MGIFFGRKKGRYVDPDSGLPFGWLYQHKELVDTILQEALTMDAHNDK